jgi:hypothetical protein
VAVNELIPIVVPVMANDNVDLTAVLKFSEAPKLLKSYSSKYLVKFSVCALIISKAPTQTIKQTTVIQLTKLDIPNLTSPVELKFYQLISSGSQLLSTSR